jgi:hypothetical protein
MPKTGRELAREIEEVLANPRSHGVRGTAKGRGFRDASTPTQQCFVTEQGDVEIRELDPRGWGGAARRVRGRDAAVTEARTLSKKSSEWHRGDLAGEDSALETTCPSWSPLAEDFRAGVETAS